VTKFLKRLLCKHNFVFKEFGMALGDQVAVYFKCIRCGKEKMRHDLKSYWNILAPRSAGEGE